MMNFLLPLAMMLNPSSSSATSIDIHQALNEKKIEITATSNGDYSGDCMNLLITSNGWKGNLMLPAGSHFISIENHEQDIFVVEDQILAMNERQRKFTVKGYCSQHHNSAPANGSEFKLQKTTNRSLNQLARYINKNKPSKNNFQEVVWAVSDRSSVAAISQSSEKDKALRKFVCDLTGLKDVWYTRDQEYTLNAQRQIEVHPVKISGEIQFELKQSGAVKYVLFRDEEKLIDLGGDRVFDEPGEYTFQFNVSVKSWRKGNYFFKVYFRDQVMHEEMFEV